MANAAIIENGIVVNVIISDADFAAQIGAVQCDDGVSIGWTYTDGEFSPPALPAVDLVELKLALRAAVDAQAESERCKYITPGSGQAMTYQAKAAEAQRYVVESGEGVYPFLSQEVVITGDTLADVAAVVLNMHNLWQAIGSAIEQVRLSAKAQISMAQDEATARAVVPVWPEAVS